MNKTVLVKLDEPREKSTCKSLASMPAVKVCHPLVGHYDLIIDLSGKDKEVNDALKKIKATSKVTGMDVRDGGLDYSDIGEEKKKEFGEIKRSDAGVPFIICPHCGNETTAICSDCGTAMFPSNVCSSCSSHVFVCAACGHVMKHSD